MEGTVDLEGNKFCLGLEDGVQVQFWATCVQFVLVEFCCVLWSVLARVLGVFFDLDGFVEVLL